MTQPRISQIIPTSQQAIREIQEEIAAQVAVQVESEEDISQYFEIAAFNPMQMVQRFRNLKEFVSKEGQKSQDVEETEELVSKVLDVENVETLSDKYQKENFELNAKTLKILRASIQTAKNAEEILAKVLSVYPEAALADEALEFLTKTTENQLLLATSEAKEKLNKDRSKEIKAGRNMGAAARQFSQEGLGSASSLRELYRQITQTPKEILDLFEDLTEKFPYNQLRLVIHFFLHALGLDLKSKGPSIERAELKKLLDDTRSLQGVLGIFRFFQSRMKIIQREFHSFKLEVPSVINFEVLARILVKILKERFLNPDKIIEIATPLQIKQSIPAQLVIFSQLRDALKQIAPRYFKDLKHREDLIRLFLDTQKKLEDKEKKEDE